jgi:hypothetical protein
MAIPKSREPDESVEPLAVIRAYLTLAIRIGAPVYNAGDQRGCYETYAATARMLLQVVNGAEAARGKLTESLQRAALEVDVDRQAWIMRRAFDAILGDDGPPEVG